MSRTAVLLLLGLALLAAKPISAVVTPTNSSPTLYNLANPIDVDDDARPKFAASQPVDLAQQVAYKIGKDQAPVSGAPTAVSGAPVKKDKKESLKDIIQQKAQDLKDLLTKKTKKPSLPPLPELPKLPALPKLPELPKKEKKSLPPLPALPKKEKKDPKDLFKKPQATAVSGAPVTQVSGAPVVQQKKNVKIPVTTVDLKKVIGRKM